MDKVCLVHKKIVVQLIGKFWSLNPYMGKRFWLYNLTHLFAYNYGAL